MKSARVNLPASIHQRLLNRAHETGRPFNELLQYFAIERLLYRLSVSDHSESFILKGALMFNAWGLAGFRPTRDIDLLGHTGNAIDAIVEMFRSVCELNVDPDGLTFNAKTVKGERIKEDADYEGIRITMTAQLGRTRLPIQIDIGFADVVTPAPEAVEYPVLLDHPAPRLYGYPPETVIAEKFQAMTTLGTANSRMKDFHDVWMLAGNFEFDGRTLQSALERTFHARRTDLPDDSHVIFSEEFAEAKSAQWKTFTRRIKSTRDIEMEQVVQQIRKFLLPVVMASRQGVLFKKKWDGIWR